MYIQKPIGSKGVPMPDFWGCMNLFNGFCLFVCFLAFHVIYDLASESSGFTFCQDAYA